MDIKEQITKIVEKIKGDAALQESFKKDPVKTVESLTGAALPDDVVKKITEGVKGGLSLDKLSGAAEGLKKLF